MQTPEEFERVISLTDSRHERQALIAARDAEIRREERELCAKEADKVYDLTRDTVAAEIDHLDDGSYQSGPAAYATGMNRGALDIGNAIRAALAPAAEVK